jgi:hypothetical protein
VAYDIYEREYCTALLSYDICCSVRGVGRLRLAWDKCISTDPEALGQDQGSWEASCQVKCA